ncbi:MAG: hypothetical protein WA821_05720 [Anaerolineales bacterium]
MTDEVVVQTIAEHYQKTFEITHETWKERNNLFVYLVLTTSVGLLMLLRVPQLNSLLVDAIAKLLGITDPARIAQLYKDFPFDILLSVFLVIIFYFMQKLYSTNLSVMRNYLYLGAVEDEIRQHLGLSAGSVAFTREGRFYWGERTMTQKISKWYFVVVISILLLPFLILKLANDVSLGNGLVMVADFLVALMTLAYFIEYARSTVTLDVPRFLKPTPAGHAKPDKKK